MDSSVRSLKGCNNIYCCTWTSTFFRFKVSLVKNTVKLSHTTKGRWSISSTKRGTGSTTQSKSIQKWMGNVKNQETIWFLSWSKYQNRMIWNRRGQHIALKWWHLSARVYGITTDDSNLGLTQMNFARLAARRDLNFIYTSLPRVSHTVTV